MQLGVSYVRLPCDTLALLPGRLLSPCLVPCAIRDTLYLSNHYLTYTLGYSVRLSDMSLITYFYIYYTAKER